MPSVSVPIAAIGGALAPVVGSTVAGIAAPALLGAGVGALGSAVTGGNIGKGALFGGLGGGLLGGAGELFPQTMSSVGLGGFVGSPTDASGLTDVQQSILNGNSGAALAGGYTDTPGVTYGDFNPGPAPGQPAFGSNSAFSPSLPSTGQQQSQNQAAAAGISPGALGLGALSALSSIAGSNKKPNYGNMPGPSTTAATQGPLFNQTLPTNYSNRTAVTPYQPTGGDWYTYGEHGGNQPFFQNNTIPQQQMARGGALSRMYAHGGFDARRGDSYVGDQSGGQEDAVPAKLSGGEFVFDSGTVSAIGDGNNAAGARRLEGMRKQIARDKGFKHVVQPKLRKAPLSYLKKAGRR